MWVQFEEPEEEICVGGVWSFDFQKASVVFDAVQVNLCLTYEINLTKLFDDGTYGKSCF